MYVIFIITILIIIFFYFKNYKNQNKMKEIFKKIFVINLDRRKDRYNDFLNRIPFSSELCDRFSAIDGKNIKYKIDENPMVIGCHKSHKEILKIICNDNAINNDDIIMIFEDDVFFSKDFNEKILKVKTFTDLVKKQKFVLYIGGRFKERFSPMYINKFKKINDLFYEKIARETNHDCDRTTNVLILNKLTAKEIIEKTSHISESVAIDTLYNSLNEYIPDIKIYDMFPHLCYSPANYQTDIQNFKR